MSPTRAGLDDTFVPALETQGTFPAQFHGKTSVGEFFDPLNFGERSDVSRTMIGRRCRGVERRRSEDLRPAARLRVRIVS